MRKLHDSASFVSLNVSRTITPSAIAQRRVLRPMRAVMMHVRLGNVRHKLMLDREIIRLGKWDVGIANGRTCCDVTLSGKYYAAIDASYSRHVPGVAEQISLCEDGCFSKAELRVAQEWQLEEDERIAAKAASDEADRVEANERALYERAQASERIRRFKTGETAPIKKPEHDDD